MGVVHSATYGHVTVTGVIHTYLHKGACKYSFEVRTVCCHRYVGGQAKVLPSVLLWQLFPVLLVFAFSGVSVTLSAKMV